jgi:hypothetical protein
MQLPAVYQVLLERFESSKLEFLFLYV